MSGVIRYASILALCLTSCATPSLPPLPDGFDQPAMRRIVEAEAFTGPVQPSPGLWITWSCATGFSSYVEMMDFAQPDTWIRVASNIACASNAAWQTPYGAIYRVGVEEL